MTPGVFLHERGKMTKEERTELAETIIRYISPQGIRGLKIMMKANNFILLENGVSFRFLGSKKMNYVRVILNSMDTFDLTLGKVTVTKYQEIKKLTDVYSEQLGEMFRDETGLETRVHRIIGMKKQEDSFAQ